MSETSATVEESNQLSLRWRFITLEESKTAEDNMYVVEGMQFDRGYMSPYFVTDTERMVTE